MLVIGLVLRMHWNHIYMQSAQVEHVMGLACKTLQRNLTCTMFS